MYSGTWYLQKLIPQLIWILYKKKKNKNEEVKEIFILNFSHIKKMEFSIAINILI